MNKKTRNGIGLLILIIIFLSINQFREFPLKQSFIADPVILFVGDLEEGNFGWNVLQGIELAKKISELNLFDLKTVHFKENVTSYFGDTHTVDIEASGKEIKKKITKLIAEENVLAIISANTSSSVNYILEISDIFHIPVLLTVATNDQVLPREHDLAFRLLPKDSLQAKVISHWVAKQFKTSLTSQQTAIAYDAKQYGLNLQNQLRQTLGFTSLISFELTRTNEISGILERGLKMGISNWVLLGYEHQALDFYIKLKAADLPINVLMSDGGYGEWLAEVQESNVYLTFPRTESPIDFENQNLFGYAPFGYDAILILQNAISTGILQSSSKTEFQKLIGESAYLLSQENKLFQKYSFDKNGENIEANFSLMPANQMFNNRNK